MSAGSSDGVDNREFWARKMYAIDGSPRARSDEIAYWVWHKVELDKRPGLGDAAHGRHNFLKNSDIDEKKISMTQPISYVCLSLYSMTYRNLKRMRTASQAYRACTDLHKGGIRPSTWRAEVDPSEVGHFQGRRRVNLVFSLARLRTYPSGFLFSMKGRKCESLALSRSIRC